MTPPPDHLWIVGTGRVGLALGLLLHRVQAVASLTYSGRRPIPPTHPLFAGEAPPARYLPDLDSTPSPFPSGILLAVPDTAVPEVAARLAGRELPHGIPVLHLSGVLELEVLAPLAQAGCSVGALHPLCSVSDPVAGVERLRGAWFGVEGEGAARGLAARIVLAAAGRILPLPSGTRALYHAAAVFASNYLVVLLAIAERLMERAGLPSEDVRAALTSLAAGALAEVAVRGPAALTGPIARGDAETVRLHLARLSDDEPRVYSVLGREALALARERLDPVTVERLATLLEENL